MALNKRKYCFTLKHSKKLRNSYHSRFWFWLNTAVILFLFVILDVGEIGAINVLTDEAMRGEQCGIFHHKKMRATKSVKMFSLLTSPEPDFDVSFSTSIEGTVRLICGSHITNKIPLMVFAVGVEDAICYGTSGPMSSSNPEYRFGTYFRIENLPSEKELILVMLLDNELGYFNSHPIYLEPNENLVLQDEFIRCNEFVFEIPYTEHIAINPQLGVINEKKVFIEKIKNICLPNQLPHLDNSTIFFFLKRFEGEYFHHTQNTDIPKGYRILLEDGDLYFQYIGRSKKKYKLEKKKGADITDLDFENVQITERINYNSQGDPVTNSFAYTTSISFRETSSKYILEVETHERGFGWNQSFFKTK